MPKYSVIVPVYNRPDELKELLESLEKQSQSDFEVVVVEDGSSSKSSGVVAAFEGLLDLVYLKKQNEGPGLARNYGADKASGDILIFLDSDCVLPDTYFEALTKYISPDAGFFGGPDAAAPDFTPMQKAINYSMTSFLTTGGIRGKKGSMEKFKPRSFNMGIRKSAFQAVKGFSPMRFGEDIDISLKLERLGFKSQLISEAYVWHKRRTSFRSFYKQVFNSGVARIALAGLHPGSTRIVHWLPLMFVLGHLCLIYFSLLYSKAALLFLVFPVTVFFDSLFRTKSLKVAGLSVLTTYIQLVGYGLGFGYALWQKIVFGKSVSHAYLDSFYD